MPPSIAHKNKIFMAFPLALALTILLVCQNDFHRKDIQTIHSIQNAKAVLWYYIFFSKILEKKSNKINHKISHFDSQKHMPCCSIPRARSSVKTELGSHPEETHMHMHNCEFKQEKGKACSRKRWRHLTTRHTFLHSQLIPSAAPPLKKETGSKRKTKPKSKRALVERHPSLTQPQ